MGEQLVLDGFRAEIRGRDLGSLAHRIGPIIASPDALPRLAAATMSRMVGRDQTVAPSFTELFGRPPLVSAEAPGRVNLIGEHTDYNGGLVLPLAIPQRTRAELAPRHDDRVRAWTANLQREVGEYRLGTERPGRGWLDYVQGITQALQVAGHRLGGFDLRIESAVPLGSGLASSAALEVAVLRALREAFSLRLDDVEIALLGQKAEAGFVGAPVGVMDQMASQMADERRALFLDTRHMRFDRVPLPPGIEVAVIDSGISHHHAGGEYRIRRDECERASELLGFPELRDLDIQDLWRLATLPEPLDRRARHVITENARVRAAVAAMQEGNLERLGKLMATAHDSLRDDFEVSLPEIDRLVDLAHNEPGVYGARLTGGGFGGSVVLLTRVGDARSIAERVAAEYRERSGKPGAVLVPQLPDSEPPAVS
jgi:galactokinase